MQHPEKHNLSKKPELRRMDSAVPLDTTLTPLSRFGQMTSMKGISRAVRTPSRCMRGMWLLAMMIGITVTSWQLMGLTRKYLAYGTVAQTTVDYKMDPIFPDVSICQLNPLTAEKLGNDTLTLEQYTDFMYHIKEEMSIKELGIQDGDQLEELWGEIISLRGYLSNYHHETVEELEEMILSGAIVDCTWFNWQWLEHKNIHCTTTSLTKFYSPENLLCHTISLQELQQNSVRGLTVIVYVDGFDRIHMPSFHASLTHSTAKGVRVKVHSPKTLPDMKSGISISPGTETSFHLKPIKRVFLGNPYSNCVDADNFSAMLDAPGTYPSEWEFMAENYTHGSFLFYKYSSELCVSMCRQHWVLQNCSCLSTRWMILKEMADDGIRMCGTIPFKHCTMKDHEMCLNETKAIIKTLKTLHCSTVEQISESCTQSCTAPCEEVYYGQDITHAKWPHESYQLAFYEKYIQNTPLEEKFWQYAELIRMKEAGNLSAVRKGLQEVDLISQHFLQLNFQIDERSTTELRDMAATTIGTILANLGGIMNLWAGITFYTLFELIELAFYSLRNAMTRRTGLAERTRSSNIELRAIY